MNAVIRAPIFLMLAMLLGNYAAADIVVVVNAANPVSSFNHRELVDLYMGRNLHFSDGSLVLRLDQAPESDVRKQFYLALVNKSVPQVNAYWAKLLFAGRATPPQTVDSSRSVLVAVRNNRNAIGYINSGDVDDSVKVVAHVD